MIQLKSLSKIGIGSWGIGGFAEKNPDNPDAKQIDALVCAMQKGLNYIEINMWSAEGYSAYLFSEALKKSGVKRDNIFITFVGYPYNTESLSELENLLDNFLEMINSDYVDSFQSSCSTISKFDKDETYKMIARFMQDGKSRYTSFTNGNIEMIKEYKSIFKDKFIMHEVCFNFEIRENYDLGIIPFCKKNKILNTIYQPLRRNRTAMRNWPLLVELSKKYKKTQNQIILNWIYSKGYLPIVKSENKKHIDENIQALDFNINKRDLKKLDNFRPPKWVTPKIDWTRLGDNEINGDGVFIDKLPNIFDEEYDKIMNKR
jgi:diketogulonate reductase-like aldo/keto reductase